MDYWRSFRIKISHRDTLYSVRTPEIIIRRRQILMCTLMIFKVLQVSLTDSVPIKIHIFILPL